MTHLRATEAPESLRAAFTVEMTSSQSDAAPIRSTRASRTAAVGAWLLQRQGEDADLDQAAAAWGAEIAPDGRLFPDDLRASFGETVHVDDLGTGLAA